MDTNKNILITGGAGYIGSHTALQLLESGYKVIVVDNLSNSSVEAIKRVSTLSKKDITFIEGDIRDYNLLDKLFTQYNIDAVIHFAGLKAVGESVRLPLSYYENNVYGTLVLCDVMKKHKVKNLVSSSSATVYGDPVNLPLKEEMPLGNPTNPYGMSKAMVERILSDLYGSDTEWNIILLRYFNPVGAHPSGQLGEDPNGIPNNLMPYVAQVATGKLTELSIFGNDYDTPDGTGVRDYIHVDDLANGHLSALKYLSAKNGLSVFNLGTGIGYSVLDIVTAFEQASGKKIKFKYAPRRAGDVASCYADPSNANIVLNWKANKTLEDMCKDVWRWQSNNPNGYSN